MTQDIPHDGPSQPGARLRTQHYFTPQPLRSGSDPVQAKQTPSILRPHRVTLRGHTMEFSAGAGVFSKGGLDAGTRLLIEIIEFPTEARLCDLGCGWGAVGCFAAAIAPAASVWMCDINLNAVVLARHNIRHNNLSRATAWCGNGLKAVASASFGAVFCNPPVRAGNVVIGELFNDAQRCLCPGGALWVVLRTAQGAKSWQRKLSAQFGNCETIAIDGGYRILKCFREV